MSTFRSVSGITKSSPIELGGRIIQQALPVSSLSQISPFILLHHFDFMMEAGDESFYVPPHPHRGFCPITFMFHGSVEHQDSLGNHQVINDYEVQWINAGRGLMHSERASKRMTEEGGRYQGIQLWMNLPAAEKMNPPSYQPITAEELIDFENSGALLRLVSGTYENQKGPAISDNLTAMLTMRTGSLFHLQLNPEYNTAVYLLEGSITINETKKQVSRNHLVQFNNEEGIIALEATEDSEILVLSGKNIDEPMVAHGPFVMNTQTEILEAMRDFGKGKMGYLTE